MIEIRPVTQETEWNCGPAVVEMLLNYLGTKVTQKQVVEAANLDNWIKDYGTQPSHMTAAIKKLAPSAEIVFRNKADINELAALVSKQSWPVAVNWQGLFYDTPEEEPAYPTGDGGHYSVVINVDQQKDQITLLDPYPEFSNQPRTFPLSWFQERWWDIAEQLDAESGKKNRFLTEKLMFWVKPKDQ